MAGRARQQRSDKLEDLKKNIVASYGSCLLKSFESRPLERLLKSDSPEQRAQKIATNKEIIAEREAIYKKNEEEMVYELEKIMARIEASGKAAVVSGGRPPGEGLDAPTTAPAHGSQIHCTQCGNKVCPPPPPPPPPTAPLFLTHHGVANPRTRTTSSQTPPAGTSSAWARTAKAAAQSWSTTKCIPALRSATSKAKRTATTSAPRPTSSCLTWSTWRRRCSPRSPTARSPRCSSDWHRRSSPLR
eukprot:scaffold3522_cov228-Ochromonas_danica.AAC.2